MSPRAGVTDEHVGKGISIELRPAAIRAIAEQVAAILQPARTVKELWPEWMSVETASRYLDVSPERVRKLAARGAIPSYSEGRGCRRFFKRSELDECMGGLRESGNGLYG